MTIDSEDNLYVAVEFNRLRGTSETPGAPAGKMLYKFRTDTRGARR